MGLNFAPRSIQFTEVVLPPRTVASSIKPLSFVSSSPLFKTLTSRIRLNNFRLVPLLGSCNSGGDSVKRACSGDFNRFCSEELPRRVEDHQDDGKDTAANNLIGIRPEPAEWAERDEIVRLHIEHKAKCLGIPLSLRMIKRKQKWEQGLGDAGDFAFCSVKKAFSSLVFIIRELQSHVLLVRENICSEDIKEIINRVQGDMNASFVWLFQQVFSKTPTLMVYVMILLANFTVHSMCNNAVVAAAATATPSSPRLAYSSAITETASSSPREAEALESHDEMSQEEAELWKLMVEEASLMRDELIHGILDHETMKHFVSSVTVELERDGYENYLRTYLLYQMGLAEEPNHPLLLLNYARFLHLVARDYDRAEELFNRAIEVEAPDAEALSGYADFLWVIRKDLCGAEERYQQAMAADPDNPSHASRYASFLWTTGAEDTCFPITTSHVNGNNKVL